MMDLAETESTSAEEAHYSLDDDDDDDEDETTQLTRAYATSVSGYDTTPDRPRSAEKLPVRQRTVTD